MTNRFLHTASIGYGALILPFINRSDLLALEPSVDFRLDTKTYPVSFYGSTELPHRLSIFYFLLTNDQSRFLSLLKQNQDLIYIHGNGKTSTYCQTWKSLSLLEVAYLLQHHEAILLLHRYGRDRYQNDYSNGITLARAFQQEEIAIQLEKVQGTR